jgi:integrase
MQEPTETPAKKRAKKLTDATIKPKLESGTYRHGDSGLELRVLASGVKSWSWRFVSPVDFARKRMSLGQYPAVSLAEAIAKVRTLETAVATGNDPSLNKAVAREAITFGELTKLFLARTDLAPSTVRNYAAFLSKDCGELERVPAARITEHHIVKVRDRAVKRGKVVAADQLTRTLSSVFDWAMNETPRLIPKAPNPAKGLKPKSDNKPRNRPWSNDQLCALWAYLDNPPPAKREAKTRKAAPNQDANVVVQAFTQMERRIDPAIATTIRMCLLTGCRRSEVAAAKISEFQLDHKDGPMWIIPGAVTKHGKTTRGRTKGQITKYVPLTPTVQALVVEAIARSKQATAERLPGLATAVASQRHEYLFPCMHNKSKSAHIAELSATQAVDRITERLGIEDQVMHDFRTNINSWLRTNGVSSEIRAHILNHKDTSVAGVNYTPVEQLDFANIQVRPALERWASHVMRVVQNIEAPSNVVKLRA